MTAGESTAGGDADLPAVHRPRAVPVIGDVEYPSNDFGADLLVQHHLDHDHRTGQENEE